MKLLWLSICAMSELILFLAMLYFALVLLDLYMVVSGQVAPGGPMFFHEAPSLRRAALEMAGLVAVGVAAFSLRGLALRKAPGS